MRLHSDQLRIYAKLKGIRTDSGLADAMGVARSSVCRALAIGHVPSLRFYNRLQQVFSELTYEEFSLLVEETDEDAELEAAA